MTTITIRNVPHETHTELTARAALRGQSLQEYLRLHLEELARRPDASTLMARAQERKQSLSSRLSGDRILELRDRGRK
jgi:plasmid stability protein